MSDDNDDGTELSVMPRSAFESGDNERRALKDARIDRELAHLDSMRLPALFNGRFQGDVINLIGVFAGALAAAYLSPGATSLQALGKALAIGASIVIGLALVMSIVTIVARNKLKLNEATLKKARRNLYLVAAQCAVVAIGWICVALVPQDRVPQVALAVAALLVGAQFVIQGNNALTAVAIARVPLKSSMTGGRKRRRLEAFAALCSALGLAAILWSIVVAFQVVWARDPATASTISGIVGASGWLLVEVVIFITVLVKRREPRSGLGSPQDRIAPMTFEWMGALLRSAAIVFAMIVLLTQPDPTAPHGWLYVATMTAAIATLLGMVLAMVHISIKWRGPKATRIHLGSVDSSVWADPPDPPKLTRTTSAPELGGSRSLRDSVKQRARSLSLGNK